MNARPAARSFTRLAIAIIVAAIVVLAAALSYSSFEATVTKTLPEATETVLTSTVTTTVTQTGASQSYRVEFVQESNCPYGSWLFPWAVALDGQTVVQPSNATLPLSYNGSHLTGDSSYSIISFSLPDGTYSYNILPDDPLGSLQSGSVTVDGGDVVVQVYAFITAMGCSSTTTNTSTTTSQLQSSDGAANDIWAFTAFIASDSVVQGQPVQLTAVLTNISPENQTITGFVEPTIYPAVYASNGTMLWQWEPPQVTYPSYTITSGQSIILSKLGIPTSQLPSGQTYSIKVGAASIPSASDLTLTLSFALSAPTTGSVYNVTFQQIGACSPPVYTVPWSVTLGSKTKAEPTNTPLPIANGSYTAGPEPPGLYTIVFTSVPDGVYQYRIAPSGPFSVTSGTVTVNGADVSVQVQGPVVACRTTTATG